jgi:hypothetical protein
LNDYLVVVGHYAEVVELLLGDSRVDQYCCLSEDTIHNADLECCV